MGHRQATLILALGLAAYGGGAAAYRNGGAAATDSGGSTPFVWPTVRKGIWEFRSERALPNGKVQKGTLEFSACTDTGHIFRGYWGLGIIEAGGCQFTSFRISETEFRIGSQCMIRRVGVVESVEMVTVQSETSFSVDGVAQEGKRRYLGNNQGRWIRGCRTK